MEKKLKLTPQQDSVVKDLIKTIGKPKIVKNWQEGDNLFSSLNKFHPGEYEYKHIKFLYEINNIDDLFKILLGQYEIAYPSIPEFKNANYKIAFNSFSFNDMIHSPSIFIERQHINDDTFLVFDINDAEFIHKSLGELIEFYQNNKHIVKHGD